MAWINLGPSDTGGEGSLARLFNLKLIAPGPVDAIKKEWPDASVIYNPGLFPAQAVALAKRSDIVILNGIRFEGEGYDVPDMSLPSGQDALFDAVTDNSRPILRRFATISLINLSKPDEVVGASVSEMLSFPKRLIAPSKSLVESARASPAADKGSVEDLPIARGRLFCRDDPTNPFVLGQLRQVRSGCSCGVVQ